MYQVWTGCCGDALAEAPAPSSSRHQAEGYMVWWLVGKPAGNCRPIRLPAASIASLAGWKGRNKVAGPVKATRASQLQLGLRHPMWRASKLLVRVKSIGENTGQLKSQLPSAA